jgi:Asp-tRNA(Asn)/Glu-tRNA(Gln) amidotransferase A subunit family amidase
MTLRPLSPPNGWSGVEELVQAFRDRRGSPIESLSAGHTMFANYFGLPAISVPCGFDERGLPLGLQIVGKPRGDVCVLERAYRHQNATDFAERRPLIMNRDAQPHGPFAAELRRKA